MEANKMQPMKLSTLINEDQIQKRIKELGAQITKNFQNEKDLVAICVLRGAFMFYADLMRRIDVELTCDFLGVSSYQGSKSTGEVKLVLDLSSSIRDKNILIVEDIVDTGLTMNYLLKTLKARQIYGGWI
jgi:hypoxanthine phosphoribosyltransferase